MVCVLDLGSYIVDGADTGGCGNCDDNGRDYWCHSGRSGVIYHRAGSIMPINKESKLV